MLPTWALSKVGLFPTNIRDMSLAQNKIWDGFYTADNIDSGNTTAKYNGMEYVLPEASGGSWAAAVEVLTGTYAATQVSIAKDSSEQVWIVAEDAGDEIDVVIRNAANDTDVLADTQITSGGATAYKDPLIAIDDQDNGWIIFHNDTTNDELTLTVIDETGAKQHTLDSTQVDSNDYFRHNDSILYDIAYDGNAHVWLFGTPDANTAIWMKGYNTTDGSAYKASTRIMSGPTFNSLYVCSDTTNKRVYLAAASAEEITVYQFNGSGDIVGSNVIALYQGELCGIAVSGDGQRLCLSYKPGSNLLNFTVLDTNTLRVIGGDAGTYGTDQIGNKRSITAGPDDRFYSFSLDSNADITLNILNKDGQIFTATDNVDEAAGQPCAVWNNDTTSNFLWVAYRNTADDDIDVKTYDWKFDTNASGFVVRNTTVTLANTIARGVTTWWDTLPTNCTIDFDVSVDNAANFDTSITKHEVNEFSNTGTQVVLKATLKSTVDYSTPELHGWAFVGEKT